jgi:RNA polymerase sigma factor (sigma-70 family)
MKSTAMSETAVKTFNEVAMPHLDAAFNLARWLTGNSHDAEDVTQEAFLRAYKFFHTFRGDDARSWLLKIVRNTFYTFWRQDRRHDSDLEFDEDMHSAHDASRPEASCHADLDPAGIVGRKEEIRLLDQALATLPTEFREALVLREIEDLSYKQIASALEIPIGTVMSRIARGRQLLLAAYQRISGEPDHEMRRIPGTARRLR